MVRGALGLEQLVAAHQHQHHQDQPGEARRAAGELGEDAPLLHEETGADAKRLGLDGLYALGNLTQYTARAYGAGAKHFDAMEDLLAALEAELAPGVTVLVKGSRFMRMERVVHALGAARPGEGHAA